MPGYFQKNLVHPNTFATCEKGKDETTVPETFIPIRVDPKYLHCAKNFSDLSDCDSFVVRRYSRNADVPVTHETYKYEVVNAFGNVVYYIIEQTETFVKRTSWYFQRPYCREFALIPTSSNLSSNTLKLVAEFNRMGYCHRLSVFQLKRKQGTLAHKCSFIPNSAAYSVLNCGKKEIISIRSEISFRSNILCLTTGQKFIIHFERGKRSPKGEIVQDYFSFSIKVPHEETDPWKRLMLICVPLLLDLQAATRQEKGILFACTLTSCMFQLVASVICYFIIVVFILLIVTIFANFG